MRVSFIRFGVVFSIKGIPMRKSPRVHGDDIYG